MRIAVFDIEQESFVPRRLALLTKGLDEFVTQFLCAALHQFCRKRRVDPWKLPLIPRTVAVIAKLLK